MSFEVHDARLRRRSSLSSCQPVEAFLQFLRSYLPGDSCHDMSFLVNKCCGRDGGAHVAFVQVVGRGANPDQKVDLMILYEPRNFSLGASVVERCSQKYNALRLV